MFGVGLGEFMLIAFIAVLVFGPDKLPDLARQAGQFARKVKVLANNARDELRSELGPEYADLELTDLDPRAIIRRHLAEAMAEVDELKASIGDFDDIEPMSKLEYGERPPYDTEST